MRWTIQLYITIIATTIYPLSHFWKLMLCNNSMEHLEWSVHSCTQKDLYKVKVKLQASVTTERWLLVSEVPFLYYSTIRSTSCPTIFFFFFYQNVKSLSGSTHLLKNVHAKVWRKIWDSRPTQIGQWNLGKGLRTERFFLFITFHGEILNRQ